MFDDNYDNSDNRCSIDHEGEAPPLRIMHGVTRLFGLIFLQVLSSFFCLVRLYMRAFVQLYFYEINMESGQFYFFIFFFLESKANRLRS